MKWCPNGKYCCGKNFEIHVLRGPLTEAAEVTLVLRKEFFGRLHNLTNGLREGRRRYSVEGVSVRFSYIDVLSWFLKTAAGFYGCANEGSVRCGFLRFGLRRPRGKYMI